MADDYIGDDEDQRQWNLPTPARIAPPTAASSIPPVSLRGLPAPQGSTEDLENLGLQSHMRPTPIAKPSPIQQDQTAAQNEVSRLRSTGPGFSQIGNRYARGTLGALDTIGSIVAPGIVGNIPGTTAHNRRLIGQQEQRIAEDQGEAQKEAQTQEAKGRTDQAEAEADKAAADAEAARNPQPKPKEEKYDQFTGWTDKDGTPLVREENSGAVVRANDHKPPTGFTPVAPKSERPDTPEQQYIDEYQKQHPGATVIQAEKAFKQDTATPEKPQRVLGVTPDNKVIEITPGMTLPEGTQTVNGEIKGAAGQQAGQDALNYAKDYMTSKRFTGPGDEALMEKYFELAKPSSGFRMSQQQIEMLTRAQDMMNSVRAKAAHLLTPEAPYFSDEQRRQIVETMNRIETTKGTHKAPVSGGTSSKDDPLGILPKKPQ